MVQDYDFLINGTLGFNSAISKERPYQRATAQFRKEQFDSQATVGDQSLTGWWTRGQLSFHKGAGINYYEVLEGETVLNRFKDCETVSVFEPGEVMLTKNMSSLALDATDAVPGPLSSGGGIYALTSTGVKYTNGIGSTAIDTSNSGVPTTIATSGSLYYVTNGTLIERQYDAADARVNHVTNPSFEVDLSGWTKVTDNPTPGNVTLTRDTTYSKYGTYSALISGVSDGNSYARGAETTVSGLTIGVTYVASAWVYRSAFGESGEITLSIGGSTVSTAGESLAWVNLRTVFTATGTSHALTITGLKGGTSFLSPSFAIDSTLVTESPFVGDYFDGSQPGCSWQGAPHASKSNYITASSGDSTVRITSTDASWEGVWWAKGRIFAVDDSNRWYALPDAIDSVTAVDAFWSSINENPRWSLADSPGPVYISDGSDIYAITIDTDGLVPTLSSPTTVARLPLGEQVVSLAYYLSNLVVVTTRGVRVAVVQSDKIFLGPLTIEGDFTYSVRPSAYDTIVHVAGRLDGRGGEVVLCALDLSSANEDLTYPWAPVATLATDSSTADGVVVDAQGRVYAWSAGDLSAASLDELSPEGYVITGFHRYGTLDSKFFASISVRLKGTGSVEVFRVADDESTTSLGTLDAADGVGEIVLTGDAAERIALKFVLSRDPLDSTKGPTLLGYQLRALPSPKRQRMIRVPLWLLDDESNRSGQKMLTDAKARLQALETLEESDALVTFEDKVYGETGTALVESVEFERSAARDFGGVLWLTIRKVSA